VQFKQVVADYHQPLIGLAFKMVHRWEIARDLTQDVFLRLWKERRSVRFSDRIYTLLYRIAMNVCIDYLRKTKEELLPPADQIKGDSEHRVEENELLEIIRTCVARLLPKQKAVFVLREVEGFDISEIAAILKTSRSNLHLARKNIRSMLRDEYQIKEDYLYEL